MVIITRHVGTNYNVTEPLEEKNIFSFAFKSVFIHCCFDTALWDWYFLGEITSRSNLTMDFVQKLARTTDKLFM